MKGNDGLGTAKESRFRDFFAAVKPWASAVISGLLLSASFPTLGWWPLAFVALVPLWWAVLERPDIRSVANLAGVCGLVFYPISLIWMVKVFGPAVISFWCLYALSLVLHAVLLWRLRRRLGEGAGPDLLWVLGVGLLWTGVEYFRGEVWWLRNTWLALGYSQAHDLPLLQSASLFGLYGLSGLLAASNAAVLLLLKGRKAPAAALAALLAALGAWGAWRVSRYPADQGKEISVAVVQNESADLQELALLSLGERAKGADLNVWPEYSYQVQPGQEDAYLKLAVQRLKGSRAVSVLGAFLFPEEGEKDKRGKHKNWAWVVGPDGVLLGRYDKMHPIQYVEHWLAANPDPRPVDTPLGRLGVQICYDFDFADGSRKMARSGAQLLVVPNMDPVDWGPAQHRQHSDMAPVRAVEAGLWAARAASSGMSQLIDPVGRVMAELPFGVSDTLVGKVRMREGGTLCSKGGWLAGPLGLLAALAAAAELLLSLRRS